MTQPAKVFDYKSPDALHVASRDGAHRAVVHLLKRLCVDAARRTKKGLTALHVAAQYGQLGVAKTLVRHHKQLTGVLSHKGLCALYTACVHGHWAVAKFLASTSKPNADRALATAARRGDDVVFLNMGARLNTYTNTKRALCFACGAGHLATVQALNAREPGMAKCSDAARNAVRHGHLDVVAFLLGECEAGVKAADVFQAVVAGDVAMVELLGGPVDVARWFWANSSAAHPFVVAAGEGNLPAVRLLIKHDNADANLALVPAAAQGRAGLLRAMLGGQYKASVNFADQDGRTALIAASIEGHWVVVRMLLVMYKADARLADKTGKTALTWALEKERVPVVRQLFKHGGELRVGTREVLQVLTAGSLDTVRVLVERGHYDLQTVLQTAVRTHRATVVRKLICELGVDFSHVVWLAVRHGKRAIVQVIHDRAPAQNYMDIYKWIRSKHGTALCVPAMFDDALKRANVNVAAFLAKHQTVDFNGTTKRGATFLIRASAHGHLNVVRFLVKCGKADVDRACPKGWTALKRASNMGFVDIARFLICEGRADVDLRQQDKDFVDIEPFLIGEGRADVDMRPQGRLAALHHAVISGSDAMVRLLVGECKADVDVTCKLGFTPLMVASARGHIDIARYLVKEGKARVDIVGGIRPNTTALGMACMTGNIDIVKMFVRDCNMDVNDQSLGATPLVSACAGENLNTVKFLIFECQADPNLAGTDGRTPLSVACRRCNFEIVRFLVGVCHADVDARAQLNTSPEIVQFLNTKRDDNAGEALWETICASR